MTEFDFDELDKAVNSLMGDGTSDAQSLARGPVNPSTDTSQTKTEVNPSKSAQTLPASQTATSFQPYEVSSEALLSTTAPTPEDDTPLEAPAEVYPPIITGISAPATKRSGRFMDVVHPSSDMTKSSGERPTPRHSLTLEPQKPSLGQEPEPTNAAPTISADSSPDEQEMSRRNGAALSSKHMTIEPMSAHDRIGEVIEPETEISAGEVPDFTAEPYQPEADGSSQLLDSSWPLSVGADESDARLTPNDALETSTTEDQTANHATTNLLGASPFIANAQVEKRPLGGIKGASNETPPSVNVEMSASDNDASSASSSQDISDIENTNETLPDELSGALLGIESDETNPLAAHAELNHTQSAPEPAPSTPSVESYSADDTTSALTSNTPNRTAAQPSYRNSAAETPVSLGVQSGQNPLSNSLADDIEDTKTAVGADGATDQVSADASVYHQPLAHGEEKKTHWLLIVIAIVSLMVIGGGIAAYFYLNGQGFNFGQFL